MAAAALLRQSDLGHLVKYLVISPVKDEGLYVEHTLRSMIAQTVQPLRWIIVDDGSRDQTPEILDRYQKNHGFIRVVRNSPGQIRQPGSGVIRAFNRGLETAGDLDYDFIVKLDCDLSFDADYFEKLLHAFSEHPRLGIASGVYQEASEDGRWIEVPMPSYHAAGASKVVRRACFEEIGGFVAARGWDTVDEIRAMALGWDSRHFSEFKLRHLKPEGSGIGSIRTNMMHGEIYYLTGGSKLFFALKVVHRAIHRPFLIGGLALFWGYMRAVTQRRQRLVSAEEARCYRSLLNGRLTSKLKGLFRRV
jgi:glycosyltransferase involved in cell wall biosynthesis